MAYDDSAAKAAQQAMILACIQGAPGAWERLQERYKPFVYSICLSVCENLTIADDAYQATFVEVWRNLPHLRLETSLTSWIGRIAYRQSMRIMCAPAPPTDPALRTRGKKLLRNPDPGKDLARLEHLQILQEALDAIPDPCKELLRSVFFEEATPAYKAISAQLNIAVGTIGAKRARCLGYLRRELNELKPGFIEEFVE